MIPKFISFAKERRAVAQDVKTILTLLPAQSAFFLLGKSKLVQVSSERYTAHKKSDAYLQFVLSPMPRSLALLDRGHFISCLDQR